MDNFEGVLPHEAARRRLHFLGVTRKKGGSSSTQAVTCSASLAASHAATMPPDECPETRYAPPTSCAAKALTACPMASHY